MSIGRFSFYILLCSVGMPSLGFGATEKEHSEILEFHQVIAKVDKGREKKGEDGTKVRKNII